jgi:para-nitrobenzyl esterase
MKRVHRPAAGLAALCLAVAAPFGHAAEATRPVQVTGGEIAGLRAGALNTWLGIPFAAPPVGKLRWRAPQPVVPWHGVRQAQGFAPACAQTAEWITHPKSEDCLYLNVWAPAAARKLPVIVWIHGGGYYGGTAAQPLYDGANLARRGAVVVTLNYRLGVFGFFAHPELAAESQVHASGNQGLLDQVAALRWVKDNIGAFGGDPARVTIVGESAGGESVAVLVASPLAKGLFQRAIAQSGNDALPMEASENGRFDRKTAEAQGLAFARTVRAEHLADLRALPVETLHGQPWSPRTHVDGYLLREDLTTTYRRHRQNDVPLLVGWNAEEGKDLAAEIVGTDAFTPGAHRALVTKLLGRAPSDALLAAYPGATDAQARASMYQLTNDWWGWRMVRWAQLQAQYGRSKPYVYYFAHQPAEPLTPCGYACGAGHGAEIQYVFDNLGLDARPWTTADRQLAARLADTWVAFARTGSPNGTGLPAWPAFDGSTATVQLIGGAAQLKAHPLPAFSIFQEGVSAAGR